MANINLEIDNQKRDIERSRTELSQMYLELGEVAAPWHDAIGYAPSQEAFAKLVALSSEKDEIDRNIDALKTAVSEMSAGDRRIEQTKHSMKELDNRLSVLISSLGAVAIEADSAGKLPQRLRKFLEPMREYEARMADLKEKYEKYRTKGPALMAGLYEMKIQKARGEVDAVFSETGRRIYNSGDFREVPGPRAEAILDEMEQIRAARKNFKNDILDHRNMIDEAHGSLVSMGAYGEENRKLRELQARAKSVADKLSDVYTEYGQRLSEGIPCWMDDQAPDELKGYCGRIIRQTERIAQQNLNLDQLVIEKDIGIHNLQLSRYSEQMNHLNSQIQAIENQKAELQQKVDAELKAISELKMRQSGISENMMRGV